jgi:amidase
MTQIHDLSVLELAAAVRQRELSPSEITGHYLDRIERLNAEVGAFYTVTANLAREQAGEAEKALAQADDPRALPPLTVVPIPIKDLNMVAGVRQTLGSLTFEDNVPAEDDFVTAQLRAAGAVITGKTATPEFGLPCYTETAIGPPARTPWDLSRSAGGSSGGAGAAVAAGLAPAAQGSDGGGSIRIPSSVCGLFGIKPSRGRISSAPLMPDLMGLGVDGPLARTVADAALLLDVMTGNQPGDMYIQPPLPPGQSFLGYARREPGRLRIGRTLEHAVEGAEVHPDCVAAYEEASALLAGLGHEVVDIAPPFGAEVVPAFEALWYAMATLAPVDPSQEDRLLPLTRYLRGRGQALGAQDLILAQAYLQLTVRAAWKTLNDYDAVLTPTLASHLPRWATSMKWSRPRTSSGRSGSRRTRPCIT